MNKWDYINLIRVHKKNNRYGRLLIELMDKYNKGNLKDLTWFECREFYKKLQTEDGKE